ncbi:MAG: ABC transporter substrate-binding protein [Burkholderiales bacterium]|nr:ABC transporter substrate-binding protein [Burkholderiales bacterium]
MPTWPGGKSFETDANYALRNILANGDNLGRRASRKGRMAPANVDVDAWRGGIMRVWPWFLVVVTLLGGCDNWSDPATARARRAASADGEIVIGAVWPWSGHKGSLWQGIELAAEEINAQGGILGRPVRIIKEDDEASLAKGRLIAQQFAENRDMVAVIGHLNSYIALPASSMYQAAGLLYLTPGASDYQINLQGHKLIFRSSPSNRSLGSRMAEYMAARGYHRVAVAYVKDKTSQGMANYFEQRARELGMTIVDRRSYAISAEDFGQLTHTWKDLYQFDAIFLAGNMPVAGQFIKAVRSLGMTMPIVGGDGMDTPQLLQLGALAEGVVVPEIYDADTRRPAVSHFEALFQKKYGHAADTFSAQGYDALQLVAQAMRQARGTVPDDVARALRATRKWQGVTGEVSFDDLGDMPERKIGQKIVRDGRFVSLP